LVFDGDCAFCTRCVERIPKKAAQRMTVVAWQFADLDSLGLTAEDCIRELQFVDGARHYGGHRAVAEVLRRAGLALRLIGRAIEVWPVSPVAAFVYRKVAANRYRLPGGTAACALPAAGQRSADAGGSE
jgi:predicted DCC family thiol-disulfide oxidoreductase YuxK